MKNKEAKKYLINAYSEIRNCVDLIEGIEMIDKAKSIENQIKILISLL